MNMKFFEHNGFSVVAGTNARENDVLTMSSRTGDLWFHASGVPGSHVIVKSAANVDTDTVKFAAGIAAKMSKAPVGAVSVDYTDVSNVEKRKFSKAGEVFLLEFQTVYCRK
jgi:predicted ribosome quality control (RQC) complex YloA/Tae2 family protein